MRSLLPRENARPRATRGGILLLFALFWAVPAVAAVDIGFYSRELGDNFPHAFVVVRGTLDSTGQAVDSNFGFAAVRVTPAVLMGSVAGALSNLPPAYIASSHRHFGLRLSDAEYKAVLAVVEKWRTLPQPSYNLNRRNCVFFVADIAATLGLSAAPDRKLMKKPTSFLLKVRQQNEELLAARAAAAPLAVAQTSR